MVKVYWPKKEIIGASTLTWRRAKKVLSQDSLSSARGAHTKLFPNLTIYFSKHLTSIETIFLAQQPVPKKNKKEFVARKCRVDFLLFGNKIACCER